MLSAGLQQFEFLFYRQFLIPLMLIKKRQLSAIFSLLLQWPASQDVV
jgi:hypothetical protein